MAEEKKSTPPEGKSERQEKRDDELSREELQKRATELGHGPIAAEMTPRAMAAHCIAQEKSRRGWQNPARLSSYEGICEGFADARKAEEKQQKEREKEREKREQARQRDNEIRQQPAMR